MSGFWAFANEHPIILLLIIGGMTSAVVTLIRGHKPEK